MNGAVRVEAQAWTRAARRFVDTLAVTWIGSLLLDQGCDQSVRRLPERLGLVELPGGHGDHVVHQTRLGSPVDEIVRRDEQLLVAGAALGHGRHEVEHGPVGGELEPHDHQFDR